MRRNAQPEEEIFILGLHPSHDNLHGQDPLCCVCKERMYEISGVLVIVLAELDVAQGRLTLLLHVLQVGSQGFQKWNFYSGDNYKVTEL